MSDLGQGSLEYDNAGHDYPFVVRADGSVEDLVEGGTVLGFLENARYEHKRIEMQPDDLLVLYSDGVTDRGDCSGERFGVERLKEAALRNRRDPARLALYSLLGGVKGWSSGSPAEDDMTLVVARFR